MKVTYIKLFKRNDEKVLMKHLRNSENPREFNLNLKKIKATENHRRGDKMLPIQQIQESFNNFWNKEGLTKKLLKKNQVILVATALMLVTAGYLNYTNNIKIAALGDAQLVSANVAVNEEIKTEDNAQLEDEVIETSINNEEFNIEKTEEEKETNEEIEENISQTEKIQEPENEEKTVQTSSKTGDNEYFTKTKLEREKMYSQMLETYQKIMENSNIPSDQKAIASNEIKNINDKKNAIATIENLIKVKGFDDVAILLNGDSINIVVKSANNLETTQVAQIQNIISRELQSDIEDIHITTHQ